MGIKVIAIAPNDRWAFVKMAERILLFRPPYASSNQTEVTQKDIAKALHLHGFEECDSSFPLCYRARKRYIINVVIPYWCGYTLSQFCGYSLS